MLIQDYVTNKAFSDAKENAYNVSFSSMRTRSFSGVVHSHLSKSLSISGTGVYYYVSVSTARYETLKTDSTSGSKCGIR